MIKEIEQLQKKLNTALYGFNKVEGSRLFKDKGFCSIHGEFERYNREFNAVGNKFKTSSECSECLKNKIEKLQRQEQSEKYSKKAREIQQLKNRAGIKKRFINSSFENYTETKENARAKAFCKRYAEMWEDRKKAGGSLVLHGNKGTGKNHLATAIANHIIENFQDSVLFAKALRITNEYKQSWRSEDITEQMVVKKYAEVDLLIIDEVGIQFGSETEKMILFEIINERYEDVKPTIIISNLNEEELTVTLGVQAIDRLREGGGALVSFDWESYRK